MVKKLIFVFLFLAAAKQSHAKNSAETLSENVTDLTGSWTLVAVENINPDGSKTLPYGESPRGLMILDKNGTYAIQILKNIRPKVLAGDKNKATKEENAALVQGNNSHFGTFKIDDNKKKITFQIQTAFYPNWEGTVQERSYTLSGDELKYVVTNTTNGGAVTAIVIWKRKIM